MFKYAFLLLLGFCVYGVGLCENTQLVSPAKAIACSASTDLVDVTAINHNIRLDVRYATKNNFMNTELYSSSRCFLLRFVAEKLSKVQLELEAQGLGLKVFDGYRPMPVQRAMWQKVPDERYVSNPAKGGRHTRGTAVDLTLIRLVDGSELEMPTGFDDFTERAGANATEGICQEAIKNRTLLQEVMTKNGFEIMATEWWHFDVTGWRDYPTLEFTFEALSALP